MSPELRAFLADWLAWVERGAPEGEPYSREFGLCASVYSYARLAPRVSGHDLHVELCILFGDCDFPFGFENYDQRNFDETQHKDPARLAWVRAQLEQVTA
jgi:hypothetical protein